MWRSKILLFVLLVPALVWATPEKRKEHCDLERPDGKGDCGVHAVAVPEGGSTLGYLGVSFAVIGILTYNENRKKRMKDYENQSAPEQFRRRKRAY